MTDDDYSMAPNKIVQYLGKPQESLTREDLVKFIDDKRVKMVNFRYLGGDGRLKTLNFVIRGKEHLEELLIRGERVDGSNLFTHIDTASSDLYVVPRYNTAFLNPFTRIPSVDILCTYFDRQGNPLDSSPENILLNAHRVFKEKTGFEMHAMGELEYYVIAPRVDLFSMEQQKGYQESTPFAKWERLRCEAMMCIAQCGGKLKYGHQEVGFIVDGHREMEQGEIEFMAAPLERAADQIVLAKWVLRMLGLKYGVNISFAPKIKVGHAGTGLHVHFRIMDGERNMLVGEGGLSDIARKAIAGLLKLSPSLTAFANRVPTSYLRLVPDQEAPTHICWGDSNRSALIRIPLGWIGTDTMAREANPGGRGGKTGDLSKAQTIELRSPDGSANIHLLLAAMAVAVREGLKMEDALEYAEKGYISVNIFSEKNRQLQQALPSLPTSCWESADILLEQRRVYEEYGIFSPIVVDDTALNLKKFADANLRNALRDGSADINSLIETYINCA